MRDFWRGAARRARGRQLGAWSCGLKKGKSKVGRGAWEKTALCRAIAWFAWSQKKKPRGFHWKRPFPGGRLASGVQEGKCWAFAGPASLVGRCVGGLHGLL